MSNRQGGKRPGARYAWLALLLVALMAFAGCLSEAPQEAREGEEEAGGARETVDTGNATDGEAAEPVAVPANTTSEEGAGNASEARSGDGSDRQAVSGRLGPISYTRLVLSHAREEVQAFRVLATDEATEEDVREVRRIFAENREELRDVSPPSDFRRSHRYLVTAHDEAVSALASYENCLASGEEGSRECDRAERRVERAADRLDNGMDRLFRDLRRASDDFRD